MLKLLLNSADISVMRYRSKDVFVPDFYKCSVEIGDVQREMFPGETSSRY